MRGLPLSAVVPILIATAANASPGDSTLRPLVISNLPARCQELAVVPASATIAAPDFAAHVSVANCIAEDAMAQLSLQPNAESVAALDTAAATSLAILDDVYRNGGDGWKAIADDSKADLLAGMAVRMRIVANDPYDRAGLEPRLARWLDRADRATREAEDFHHRLQIGAL